MISGHLNEAGGRVIRFRPRTAASHRSHLGKAAITHSAPDYSPVPDLLKYERPESIDDYGRECDCPGFRDLVDFCRLVARRYDGA